MAGIILVLIVLLVIIIFLIFNYDKQHNKCLICGETMIFKGNLINYYGDSPVVVDRIHKRLGYKHVYQCPKCGTIKIV